MKRVAIAALLAAFAAPAFGQWKGWTSTDLMDDSVQKGVVSTWTKPRRPMAFPYQETEAILGLSCNNGSGEAYMRFTHGLNLSGDETHDGYNSLSLRVRFDNEEPYWLKARQPWGSDQLSLKKWGDPRLRDAILDLPRSDGRLMVFAPVGLGVDNR